MWILAAAGALLALVAANVAWWPRVRRERSSLAEAVSALIPARDEASKLPATLEALRTQPGIVEILIYDDHSTDGTAEVIERYTAKDERIRRIEPIALPAGWCGKTFACYTLAQQARSAWMLFLDADSLLKPGAVASLVAEAERRGLTMLSCWPGLEMEGFWEKLLMPMLNFVVFTLYPAPLAVTRPADPSLGLAHGALILARKDAYERVGGHAAVRAELFEDTILARLWRKRGETSLCLDGQNIVSTRMYAGVGEIWRGFQKNFYPAFRSQVSFWLFLALHGVVFLGPFLTLNWAAAGCVLGMRILLALRFRHPLWSCFLHPASEAFLLALGLSSWWRGIHGGLEWKGRRYARN